ncbi:MAG: hypothetical protein AMXMBFR7_02710 [Planctomycetota bacterium]
MVANSSTNGVANVVTGAIGGERDITITETGGANITVGVNGGGGSFVIQSQVGAIGTYEVQYDLTDGDETTLDSAAGSGLAALNLTLTSGGTQNAFVINMASNAVAFTSTLRVYSDTTVFSRFDIAWPVSAAPLRLVIPYSAFVTGGGATGPADFTAVTAITLSGTIAGGVSLALSPNFETTQEITASLVASLQVDVNGDGFYQPGDTIRYTATLTNPDDDANLAINNVDINIPIPTDTTLVPASVVAAGGTINTTNPVNVTFASIADNATAVVTFDVLIDDPLTNAGTFQITAQGTVQEGRATQDFIVDLLTDDEEPPMGNDPTVVDLNHFITGVVFVDDDGDGFDNDTMPLAGVSVELLDSGGTALVPPIVDITDAAGAYGLSPPATAGPDDYIVQVTLPGGRAFTVQDQTVPAADDTIDSDVDTGTGQTAVFSLDRATNIGDFDAGVFTLVTISGRVFEDVDGDGQYDGGVTDLDEPDGFTVNLLDGAGTFITSTTTATATYSFTGLAPGSYIVEFDDASLRVGYGFTTQDSGADATDSDANPDSTSLTHGQTAVITLTSGVDNTTTFAGTATATISGRIFDDRNDNAQYGAPPDVDGPDGFTVNIYDINDLVTPFDTTTTSGGTYSFQLPPGDYVVEFDPAGLALFGTNYTFVPADVGSDATDSDANVTTGRTGTITLPAATVIGNVFAGANNIVDLTVTKTVNNPSPSDGGTVTYTITVTNNSTRNTAAAVEITDDLAGGSGGITIVAASSVASAGSFNEGTGVWDGFSLAPGATETLTYDATIDFVAGGPLITNTVVVTGIQGVDPTIEDLDQDDNDDTATVSVSGGAIKVTNMNLSLNFKKHLFPTANLTDTLTASGRVNLAAFVTASVDEAAFLTEVRFYAFRVVVGTPGGPVDITLNTPMKASSKLVSWQSNRSARPNVRASFSPTTGAFSVSIVNDDIYDALGAPAALNMLPAPATVDVPLAICIGPFNVDPATGDPAEYATNSLVYTLRKPDTVGKGAFRFGSVGQPPTELTFVDFLAITQRGNVIDGFEQRAQVKLSLVRDPMDPLFDPATFGVDIGVGAMPAVTIPPGSFTGTNGKFSLTGPAALALGFSQVSYDETRFIFTFTTDWLPDGTFGETAILDVPGDPRRAIIVPIQVSITDGMATTTNFLASGVAGRAGAVFSSTAPTVIFAGQ